MTSCCLGSGWCTVQCRTGGVDAGRCVLQGDDPNADNSKYQIEQRGLQYGPIALKMIEKNLLILDYL